MEDAGLVVTVAIEMLRRHGENAPPYLRDQAEIAVGLGDQFSARAWEDIADATEAMLRRTGFWNRIKKSPTLGRGSARSGENNLTGFEAQVSDITKRARPDTPSRTRQGARPHSAERFGLV